MTVETALYPSQFNTNWPQAADMVSEGDNHIRLIKIVEKTTWANIAGAVSASHIELNYVTGVTSGIQSQLNAKGSITGQTWTGAHVFSGSAAVPTLALSTSTTGAASTAFVQNEWSSRMPNYTAPITASTTELNYSVGVTSGIQGQINTKGAIAGQAWTGAHVFTGATVTVPTLSPGTTGNSAASVDYVNAAAVQTLTATSTTANTPGLGSKSFTIQANRSFVPGMYLVATSAGAPSNSLSGTITSYDSATGALVIIADAFSGASSRSDWNLGVAAAGGTAFLQSGTGAVSRTTQDKLRDVVSPLDFGAVGDGTTNDTTALQATLDAASGRPIDLLGKTYKVNSSLAVPSNTTLENGVIDASSMVNADTLLEAYGTMGSAVSMNTISSGASSFVVSSATGIAADVILYLESTTIFGSGATKNGELIKVRQVAGTTITPYRRVYDFYQAGQQFYKPTMKRNITLRNLRFIGGGNGLNHVAFHALLCENVVVENCYSSKFADRHFQVQRCMNARFTANHMEHSDDATGMSYGIVVANGCDKVTITGCTGIDMRHAVTIGAENGVDRHVSVTGCTFTGCTDSPIDTHSQAQFVTITGNTCGADATLNSQDGLVVQGTDCVVTGNVVTGFDRAGILLQPLCVNSNFSDTTTCTGNIVTASSAGAVDAYGLSYDNQRTGGAARVNISGNTINVPNTQGYGINFEIASSGSTVTGLVMNDNNIYTRRIGIRIFTAANKFLRSSVISGNAVETLAAATYDAIELNATTAGFIERVMLVGNSTYGGRYGINVTNVSRVVANSNMLQAFATAATNGTFAATADNFIT